jgi:hypothetical protein
MATRDFPVRPTEETPCVTLSAEETAALLRASLPSQAKHSIMELDGLDADVWQGIDAQEYVNQERAS